MEEVSSAVPWENGEKDQQPPQASDLGWEVTGGEEKAVPAGEGNGSD